MGSLLLKRRFVMTEQKEKTITLNDKLVTFEEFSKLKESFSKRKDVILIEVAPNIFKTQIRG
jgi:hypothetical protein